ncbi:hypothetical protein A2697_05025 [Candidatus Curtissbacteria bacterium RIFCSPHIGHO2_01_FULL_41_44]|uniref:Uncharacterized protein n=1 Tax=Candidatus Curtissbacteria bacterium RIFCSPLOWO2_01_FULL_42_50 TaxID=1797730 RepID=A0A1F5H5T9_9BACT|nr:MAG: hypothetical protein A2697_05025 [Candidatus Curtissbacteria bacterium RIFCSPHIGHO2_01_FULL_41_44]OGD93802.1 MAG: hypothetical protein A3C33_03690 [Candidatus Curtissbacteria bacterium RIFCSPHIGHO2_02_FULL_42_58]OGD97809.1 MAG: hypothetical protein A3E71_01130 [Candidatus Curtissbacteria bacterium RIFCSPHIGHO2_12_FULL_42_33]OGD99438.1 MAG: hypothetical protein A3B54_00900 [Candidatus Curtissbacteria bacterium RIFCSPLOWO2_01_FULL_42_50]OGE03699.1 MAG: hypothetical protein A3G16_02400 [Ca
MSEIEDYQSLMSDLIKKQMIMLGPNLVLSKARQVKGLTVGDDGAVLAISGEAQTALQQLANEFMNLSGQIAQMTLNTLLAKYPGLKKPS